MEFHSAGRSSGSASAVTGVKITLRTCTSTLAISVETRDLDPIKVVGGESGMGEEEKSDKGPQMHRVDIEEPVWGVEEGYELGGEARTKGKKSDPTLFKGES